jgi:hypothetical protein
MARTPRLILLWLLLSLAGGISHALAQTVLLDNFEANTIRVVQPAESDPVYRFLWNQYPNDFTEGPDPGVAEITSEERHDGTRSLQVTVQRANTGAGGNVYLQFYPHDGSFWHWMREYTQSSASWRFNTYNRLRFWVKVPRGTLRAEPGRTNFDVGTYLRRSNGSRNSAEDGGSHWYHDFNIPYTGQWHQVIVDTHPDHERGANGGSEQGNQEHATGENGFNYFDALTRFYFSGGGGLAAGSYPAHFYFDGFELYRETHPENVEQIYSLNGVYVPSSNEIYVGWQRNKNENNVNHEVRYAFRSIHETGWASATPAPNGIVSPPGWQGYNGMEYSTRSINMSGQKVVYIAIKPQNSSRFREIAMPLSATSSPPTQKPLKAPRNLRIVQN